MTLTTKGTTYQPIKWPSHIHEEHVFYCKYFHAIYINIDCSVKSKFVVLVMCSKCVFLIWSTLYNNLYVIKLQWIEHNALVCYHYAANCIPVYRICILSLCNKIVYIVFVCYHSATKLYTLYLYVITLQQNCIHCICFQTVANCIHCICVKSLCSKFVYIVFECYQTPVNCNHYICMLSNCSKIVHFYLYAIKLQWIV